VDGIPERLTSKPSWLITQLATHARRLSAEGHGRVGAGVHHYRVLAALHESGAASQTDLARRGNLDRSDVVAAVNELAAAGYVERTADPDDRRRNVVRLTRAGSRQLQRMDRALARVQNELLEPLSVEERQALTRLLTRLLAHHRAVSTTDRPSRASIGR
jgi:DNA-binding MarR family transcriptional regulator